MSDKIPYPFPKEGKEPEDVDELVFFEEIEPFTVSNR